ncbi:MAG: threonine ammonia-lyase [Erysipelotrichaceae bacterium]
MIQLSNILEAQQLLQPIIQKTPLVKLKNHENIYLKAENLQTTGAFKIRGAYVKISKLTAEQKALGVIAASAGNHAQGVAKATQMLHIRSTIVMPKTAPLAKINATRKFGANVILQGDTFNDAYTYAKHLQELTGQVFVEPFDDFDIIAGQGTIGVEILEKLPETDVILVPVGGGGLISGIAVAAKALKPEIQIIGVQAESAASMKVALEQQERVILDSVSTMADGIAVKQAGVHTFALCTQFVDQILTISESEIAASILYLLEDMKMVAEGAGAIALAPILFEKIEVVGKNVVAVLSGGNIDVNFLAKIIDTGLVETGRKATLNVRLVDKPGNLVNVLDLVAKAGANIVSVDHERGFLKNDYRSARVRLVLELNDRAHLLDIVSQIEAANITVEIEE